jgi:hypothetical protein
MAHHHPDSRFPHRSLDLSQLEDVGERPGGPATGSYHGRRKASNHDTRAIGRRVVRGSLEEVMGALQSSSSQLGAGLRSRKKEPGLIYVSASRTPSGIKEFYTKLMSDLVSESAKSGLDVPTAGWQLVQYATPAWQPPGSRLALTLTMPQVLAEERLLVQGQPQAKIKPRPLSDPEMLIHLGTTGEILTQEQLTRMGDTLPMPPELALGALGLLSTRSRDMQ